MKNIFIQFTRPLIVLLAILTLGGAAYALFFNSEPEPTLDEIYIDLQTASDSVAESLKQVLTNEFKIAADIAARDAKAFYAENMEEKEGLKVLWNDRKGDLKRIESMNSREIIGLIQWAMFEKEQEAKRLAEKKAQEVPGKLEDPDSLLLEIPN